MSKTKAKNRTVKGHLLYNAIPKVWAQLKKENKLEGIYKKRGRYITFMVYFVTYPAYLLQQLLYRRKIENVSLEGKHPIFLIGHWRSGTTHLHYLLHKDPQYGSLSNYQSFLYNVAFLSKSWLKFILSPLMPSKRPQDNIKMSPDLPAEEEQPFSVSSIRSGFHTWNFPHNFSYFHKYNVFKDITPEEKKAWQHDYHLLLQNITLFNEGKQLILKNPHNTGRIKELLELYPDAKFINLYRNPYDVILSTIHLFRTLVSSQFMQFMSIKEREDMIIYMYKKTMQKNLAELHLIPEGNLVQVRFDDLEKDSMAELKRIYTELNLPNFEQAEPHFKEYLASVKNYKKNSFRNIRPELTDKINKELKFAFEALNYEMEYTKAEAV